MNIEGALEMLKQRQQWASDDEDTANIERRTKAAEKHREEVEAFGLAIDALEKQIPKEPEFIDRDAGCFECSVCGMLVYCSDEPESHKYCLGCGQALKWD